MVSSSCIVAIASVVCTGLVLGASAFFNWRARSRNLPLPPGPRPLPIVGNILDMPTYKPWFKFREMSAQYGDLIYLRVMSRSILVIGSASLATEFLDKRSANSADRPSTPMTELAGQSSNFAFMPYGPMFQRYRRMFWQQFHPGAISEYHSAVRQGIHQFLASLLVSPKNVEHVMLHSFTGSLLKVVYGIDVTGDGVDANVAMLEEAATSFGEATAGHLALEAFPFLRFMPPWFPGTGFQPILSRCKLASDRLRKGGFAGTKRALGKDVSSVTAKLLAKAQECLKSGDPAEDEDAIKDISAISALAGFDTTLSTLQALFLALAMYPHVQKKAQEELDAVVGPSRLPKFDDRDKLVYVNAIIKETLRWHVVGPMGLGHQTIKDDEFHGYLIPAGTIILPNVWDILHDPEVYEDPFEFRPERFIRDGELDPTVRDPVAFMFGFGRRICPGRFFALDSLFINAASVLHVFNVLPRLDKDGVPVKLKYAQTHGLVTFPEEYPCMVVPRSTEAADLIKDTQHT
ncbi:CyP450 monooxygenase [Trametes elegans]|nr:CyP450 monooxygenase [Trametes elegans]